MKSGLSLPALLTITITLFACTTPAVVEPHADPATRMSAIAQRFEQARRQGGMTGVIEDIGNCYESATSPIIEVFALRDCLVLDYVAYRTDFTVGRRLNGGPLPFFEDNVFNARETKYAQLDGFTTPQQLVNYLRDGNAAVQQYLILFNEAPIIEH